MADDGFSLDVDLVEELGADGYIYGTMSGLTTADKLTAQQIVARVSARKPSQRGTTIKLNAIDPAKIHVFSEKTQERLND